MVRVPGKWASLRSRIRGGQDYLADKVPAAAQFLTLRLIPIGSTHMGCDDSDGPGHAPRYLDVSTMLMKVVVPALILMLLYVLSYGALRHLRILVHYSSVAHYESLGYSHIVYSETKLINIAYYPLLYLETSHHNGFFVSKIV